MSQDDPATYTPMAPYYDTTSDMAAATPPPPARAPRRGPLSSRLEARKRLTPLVDTGAVPIVDPSGASVPSGELSADDVTGMYTTGGPAGAQAGAQGGPVWEMLTGILRKPGEAADALREGHDFGARWASRADMLGACLDEYYQLAAKYNDARVLLSETEQDLGPLRQQQVTSYMTLRELEAHLELHSRAELRAAYLGAAQIEMRVFRVEQERDLLSSRIETLEGFMGFLSHVIATIRAIPAEAMEQPATATDGQASPGDAAQAAEAWAAGAAADDADAFEELEIDADEAAALVARGDVEVIGAVEEVSGVGNIPARPANTGSLIETTIQDSHED